MLDPKSSFECRLELTRLEPLDEKSAIDLIEKPLIDMGFEMVEQEKIINRILTLTGRLPHLIHFFGDSLAKLSITDGTNAISLQQLEKVEGNFMTAQYFIKPINDLEDAEARLIALLLLKENYREFSVPLIQSLASKAGFELGYKRTFEICNDLVINNVLAWKNSSFCIANEGLHLYARKVGYLGNVLEATLLKFKPNHSRDIW
jgi:hypothetical protein